jgi:hypothetical protein
LEHALDFDSVVGKHAKVLVPSICHFVAARLDSAARVHKGVVFRHQAGELRNITLVDSGDEGFYDIDLV